MVLFVNSFNFSFFVFPLVLHFNADIMELCDFFLCLYTQ